MHVEIFKSSGIRPWRYRLVGGNGEPMTRSQGYSSKWSAKRGARKAHAGIEIRDLTKEKA